MPKITLRSPITVVVTIEGLATSGLSCYGCSWNETPEIDAISADGVVWDRWTSPIDRPNGLIRRWLVDAQRVIADRLDQAPAVFLTDDQSVPLSDITNGFTKAVRIEPTPGSTPAETIDETVLSQSFASAIDAIEPTTRLLWLHSSALRDHWDAPIRGETEQDELDNESTKSLQLPATTDPPSIALAEGDDPDLVFAWMNRYAAQVRVLDTLIGLMSDAVTGRKATILLAGSSGYCLGENGWIGHRVGPLRSPEIRLPMIVSQGGPVRVQVVESADELPKLLERLMTRSAVILPEEWCRPEEAFSPAIQTNSDRAQCVTTTPTWFYVQDSIGASGHRLTGNNERLYLKPDDICDVNDVSRLRREVLDQFSSEGESE